MEGTRIGTFLALFFLLLSSACCASHVLSLDDSELLLPLRLPLIRSKHRARQRAWNGGLERSEASKLQLLQSAVESSLARADALTRAVAGMERRSLYDTEDSEVTSAGGYIWPVRSGEGDYVTEIELGSPAKTEEVLVDTGSDLVWIQCMPCSQCFPQEEDIFDPQSSSSFKTESCSASLCNILPTHACDRHSDCLYEYKYGDGSTTIGNLGSETLTLRSSNGRAVGVKSFKFGCGHENAASFAQQGPGPSGILGLGRGPLSMASQLSRKISGKFSYCLVPSFSSSAVTSPLFLGYEHPPHGVQFTPILVNGPVPTYYYVGLQGISVAGERLSIPESVFQYTSNGGGSIFDSGTTLTLLPPVAYNQIKKAIAAHVSASPVDPPPQGLDLCYPGKHKFPSTAFHFAGGAEMSVPAENYMMQVEDDGTTCLVMMSAGEDFTIIGNLQQQNFHVFYDLTGSRIGFLPTTCSKL